MKAEPALPTSRFWIALTLISMLLLTGCGIPSSHYTNKEYGKDVFRNGSVGYVALHPSDVAIDAYDQYQKAFDKIPEDEGRKKLAEAFNAAFLKEAKPELHNLAVIDSGAITDPYNQVENKLMLDRGKKSQRVMRIDMPRKGVIDSMQPGFRFLIIPRAASFSYSEGEGVGGSTMAFSGSNPGFVGKPGSPGFGANPGSGGSFSSGDTKRINLKLKYVIWDCKEDRAVSYGTYEDGINASFFFSQSEWLNLMEHASQVLLRNSPLKFSKS